MRRAIKKIAIIHGLIGCFSSIFASNNYEEYGISFYDNYYFPVNDSIDDKNSDTNGVMVFLDWNIDDTITIYHDNCGLKASCFLHTNQGDEDEIVMVKILSSTINRYQIIAFSGFTDTLICVGWTNKDIPLRIFADNDDDKPFRIYSESYYMSVIIAESFSDSIPILEVLDVDIERKWLKIKVVINDRIVIGWIPPESQCSNPYTTCG